LSSFSTIFPSLPASLPLSHPNADTFPITFASSQDFKSLISADPSIISRCTDPNGNTLLHEAARNGQKKIAKELLRNADQYDPYAKNTSGKTAVDLAR